MLRALEQGDRVAVVRVTRVIRGFLEYFGAYEVRDSWDDVCHEVLIRLIRSVRRGTIRDPGAFVSYTGTVTRNSLTDWLARRQRPGDPDSEGDPAAAQSEANPSMTRDGREGPGTAVDLKRALDALPARERSVVEAIYLNGMTYEEAARHLETPLGTLKHLQTRGLKHLRHSLGGEP